MKENYMWIVSSSRKARDTRLRVKLIPHQGFGTTQDALAYLIFVNRTSFNAGHLFDRSEPHFQTEGGCAKNKIALMTR
jgi:hypothetical protein